MSAGVPRFPHATFWDLPPHRRFRTFEHDVMSRYVDFADEIAREYIAAADDDEDRGFCVEDVRDLADRLRAAAAGLDLLVQRDRRERRIAALENTTGRTPEEAAVYRAKAAELKAQENAR